MQDPLRWANPEPEDLFASQAGRYRPRCAAMFEPRRIVLAKGSLGGAERIALADAICDLYPDAEVIERLDTPHNRIEIDGPDELSRHRAGKQTLVLGEHATAVRFSAERNNACPNYWHFAPYGHCPYDCNYCYLAGTQGVRFSPSVKVFLNLPEILAEIDRVAREAGRATSFYLGKLQDGLALEPLTGYCRSIVPFFAAHRWARGILLTKSADVDNLLDLDHRSHTTLSWSLNPPEICSQFESSTPPVWLRVEAMRKCAVVGYPVRAVLMPIIPVDGWREVYWRFLGVLLSQVPLERITLGGLCSYDAALALTETKLGRDNAISRALQGAGRSTDGRRRYPPQHRREIYRHLIDAIRAREPDLPISLCLEERSMFSHLGLDESVGRCNCVL